MKREKIRGFTLIELMIVIAVIAIIAALAIPALLSAQMAANEKNAHASLKTIITAQIEFRNNDRDGNRIPDFWTGDISGLYGMTSLVVPGNTDELVKLIDISIAGADTNPLPGGSAGGELRDVANIIQITTKAGYWYGVLDQNLQEGLDYQVDTWGNTPMGEVHNLQRFGAIVFPDERQKSGRTAAIISEIGTIFVRSGLDEIKPSALVPPGAIVNVDYKDWPTDATLATIWGKLD